MDYARSGKEEVVLLQEGIVILEVSRLGPSVPQMHE